jgi:branched-subunit amino acid transport protein
MLARALKYVPAAMLTALIVPMVLSGGTFGATGLNPRIPAAIVAWVIAWFTRSTLITLAAGMAALWILRAVA